MRSERGRGDAGDSALWTARRAADASRRGPASRSCTYRCSIIVLYAFTTEDRTYQFPPPGLTLHWFAVAFGAQDIWAALRLSLGVADGDARRAAARHAGGAGAGARPLPGQGDVITLLFVLPIALPGILTGIALLSAMQHRGARPRSGPSLPATRPSASSSCYNNVIARLRRLPQSWVEASMDLGADGWQTFRYVLLPQIATALLAGGMLAFALSFDEIIVTLFTAGHAADAADLVLQRAVPAARAPDHQRGRRRGDRGDADSDPPGLLSHATPVRRSDPV